MENDLSSMGKDGKQVKESRHAEEAEFRDRGNAAKVTAKTIQNSILRDIYNI